MPKKLKLDLKNLKVKSFVTSLDGNEKKNIHGGATFDSICISECDTCPDICQPSGATCAHSCPATACTCYTDCGTCPTTGCCGTTPCTPVHICP